MFAALPVPFMASFDVNDPDSPCPVRFNTVQPTQALAMINSEFLNEEARIFAEDLKKQTGELPKQVEIALQRVLQRKASPGEIQRGLALIAGLQKEDKLDKSESLRLFCLVTLNLNEFLFLD